MRARAELILALRGSESVTALEYALEALLESLWLNRSDTQGLRYEAPALFLRLGKYQDCYDFIKWWATCDPDGRYDWCDTSLPYLSIKGADVLEPLEFETNRIQMSLGLALIKANALQLLKRMAGFQSFLLGRHARVGASSPVHHLAGKYGLLQHIQSFHFSLEGSGLEHRLGTTDLDTEIQRVEDQCVQAFKAVTEDNRYVLPGLVKPSPMLAIKPMSYSNGSVEEAALCVQSFWPLWKTMEGKEDVLRLVRR